MIDRCSNPGSKDYQNYGKRGIRVCNRWSSFPLFLEDMEATYFKGATLDRENNDGNYDSHNVRWATIKTQARNKRHTVFVDTPWGRMSRGEAAEKSGISIGVIRSRIKHGWDVDRTFSTPVRSM